MHLRYFILPLSLGLLPACGGSKSDEPPRHALGPLRIQRFTATPPVVRPGATALLTAVFAAGHGTIDQGIGTVLSGHPVLVSPIEDTTYTLTLRMAEKGPTIQQSVTVRVHPPADRPPTR